MRDLEFHKAEKHEGAHEGCRACTERKNEKASCPVCGKVFESTSLAVGIRELLANHLVIKHDWDNAKAERYAGEIYNDKQRKNEKVKCPVCEKEVETDNDGMFAHIQMKHNVTTDEARKLARKNSFGPKDEDVEEDAFDLKETNASQDRRARENASRKNAASPEKIKARMDQLYGMDKSSLKDLVKQNYRVVDLNGVDKDSLVSMMLKAEFGGKYYDIMTGEKQNATPRKGDEVKNDNQELVKCDFCGKEVHPSKAVDRRGKVMCDQCAYDRGLEEKKEKKNEKPILIGGESVTVPLECLVTIEASMLERKNAIRPTAPAKRYEFKFIEPGLVRYEDVQNSGNILVRKETLDRMLDSFVGKPIINMMHKECDPEAFREEADGVITRAWYNAKDGWYWAEGLVWDPATQQTCDMGADSGKFSVSCAYNPTDGVDAPAEHHNIPYEGEITNGEYTHLAIVPNPRYEAAKIFRMNSKGGPPMKLFQWLKGSKQEIDPAKSIVKNGDEEVPVTKLLEVYNSSKAGSPAAIALDAEVESEGGEKVSVSKLLEVYNASKKGPEEDEEKKKEEAAAKEEERKNAAEHFRKVEEARQVSEGGVETTIKTRDEQVAAGRAMFGSAK